MSILGKKIRSDFPWYSATANGAHRYRQGTKWKRAAKLSEDTYCACSLPNKVGVRTGYSNVSAHLNVVTWARKTLGGVASMWGSSENRSLRLPRSRFQIKVLVNQIMRLGLECVLLALRGWGTYINSTFVMRFLRATSILINNILLYIRILLNLRSHYCLFNVYRKIRREYELNDVYVTNCCVQYYEVSVIVF